MALLGARVLPGAPEPLSFSLKDVSGQTVSLSDYRGQPVVVFFFRGFWCAYCVGQLVDLERLEGTVLAHVPVLAISPDGPDAIRKGLEAVEKERGVKLTHRFLSDEGGIFASRYGLAESPAPGTSRPAALFLLDENGRDVFHAGESHYQKRSFEAPLRDALARLRRSASTP